jgi:hypothetical protein
VARAVVPRVAVVWTVLGLVVGALGDGVARPAPAVAAAMGGLLAAVFAWGASSSGLLLALRRGAVVVDATAAPWRPARAVAVAVAVAAIAGAVVGVAGTVLGGVVDGGGLRASVLAGPAPALVLGAWSGVAASVLVRVPPRAAARVAGRAAWLLQGALAAGVVAGVVGGVVGVARFGGVPRVSAGELARLLAGTSLTYTLLGIGGFARTFSEARSGVVVVAAPPSSSLVPGPFVAGLVVAATCALLGPSVLPSLPGADVVAGKVVFGVVCGAGLSLLGALAGHRAAAGPR